MSLLAPLYFLGALAIGLPILFHLIRRRPRDRRTFSSLMFLSPTPPRLTRRSRLENWPLLLLRALVILMIAAAFSRPFLRTSARTESEEPEQLLMLVIDSSASMRRTGLWQQVGEEIDGIFQSLTDRDRVGLIAFDRRPQLVVSLDADVEAGPGIDREMIRDAFREMEPTWFAGDLGAALAFAADTLNETVAQQIGGGAEKQLILISDMQAGAATESLQGFDWPQDVGLDVRTVRTKKPTNVSAIVLQENEVPAGPDETPAGATAATATRLDASDQRRVRVANAADSDSSRFSLRWSDRSGTPLGDAPVMTNVPPGEVRIVRIDLPPPEAVSLHLGGDDHPFDNTVYVATSEPRSRRLLYVGSTPDDPRESLFYYLQRASLDTRRQQIAVESVPAEDLPAELDPEEIAMLVVASPFPENEVETVRRFVSEGGTTLVVLSQPVEETNDAESFLRTLSDDESLRVAEADVADYAMLADVDFQNPLFSIFTDPRFSDFTKIRFWHHRQVEPWQPDRWQVVAEFDDRAPAIMRTSIADGRLWLLAAGWQPNQSQLALSTKFVPLLSRWIDPAAGEGRQQRSLWVGDDLTELLSEETQLVLPDGSLATGDEEGGPLLAQQPGIYQLASDSKTVPVAVNIDPAESETVTMEAAELERFGIVLGEPLDRERIAETERQLRNIELERQQSWWRWLLLTAVGLLAVETWWAGRLVTAPSRPSNRDRVPSTQPEVNQ